MSKYGYIGAVPTQANGSNTGVFSVTDVTKLLNAQQWTLDAPYEHIETITASDVASIEFTSIDESKYQTHLLITTNFSDSSSSSQSFTPRIQLYESGVLQTGTNYEYAELEGRVDASGGSKVETKSTGSTILRFISANSYNTSDVGSGYAYLYNLGNSSKFSFCTYSCYAREENNNFRTFYGASVMTNASTVDGIKIFATSNFSGTFELYGVC